MRIIISGCGAIGKLLAKISAEDGHDVVVIDRDEKAVNDVTDAADVNGVTGSPISKAALLKAGADFAGMFIALDGDEALNLMSCAAASALGTKHTIARIRGGSDSGDDSFIAEVAGAGATVNLEQNAASEIMRLINFPQASKCETFADGRVELAVITIGADCALDGVSLRDIGGRFNTRVLVCVVVRGGDTIVPDGSFVLKKNDRIAVTAPHRELASFFAKVGIIKKPVKSLMLVGCGQTGRFLCEELASSGIRAVVIESDRERCRVLTEACPDIRFVLGSGSEAELLLSEGISKAGACVSLTGSDETNMVVSMFAWSNGVKNIFTRINDPSLLPILRGVDIDYTVSPEAISAAEILRSIRAVSNAESAGSSLRKLYMLADGKACALEFSINEAFPRLGVKLMDEAFKLKKDTIIASVVRGKKVIYPNGQTTIENGDIVIVITADRRISAPADIFA